jgi:hypothetical protein
MSVWVELENVSIEEHTPPLGLWELVQWIHDTGRVIVIRAAWALDEL